ncbi:hypothetical protein SCHPADRAFT_896107 [Schizopora paradoxa]|uniref:Uncharacterized protein n=1 Tax=Schizopora paradoxa TaxID=27342 RepID=A0A0H2R1K4_9AGAM|nr:hypothetical protein SCHPADRAFT_896107 [Schizopora paradoxa]
MELEQRKYVREGVRGRLGEVGRERVKTKDEDERDTKSGRLRSAKDEERDRVVIYVSEYRLFEKQVKEGIFGQGGLESVREGSATIRETKSKGPCLGGGGPTKGRTNEDVGDDRMTRPVVVAKVTLSPAVVAWPGLRVDSADGVRWWWAVRGGSCWGARRERHVTRGEASVGIGPGRRDPESGYVGS